MFSFHHGHGKMHDEEKLRHDGRERERERKRTDVGRVHLIIIDVDQTDTVLTAVSVTQVISP